MLARRTQSWCPVRPLMPLMAAAIFAVGCSSEEPDPAGSSSAGDVADLPEPPFAQALREDGYPASAWIVGAWLRSAGRILPEARESAEKAAERSLRSLQEGNLDDFATFLEGSDIPLWDFKTLLTWSNSLFIARIAGNDEPYPARIEKRPGLGHCLVPLGDDGREVLVLGRIGDAWFLRTSDEAAALATVFLGALLPMQMAPVMAWMDMTERGIAAGWSQDEMERFQAAASLELNGRLYQLFGFGSNVAADDTPTWTGVPVLTPTGVNPILTGGQPNPWSYGGWR